jgi:hypothetical protein
MNHGGNTRTKKSKAVISHKYRAPARLRKGNSVPAESPARAETEPEDRKTIKRQQAESIARRSWQKALRRGE